MLNLPDVTLFAIDTIEYELTRMAMEDCLRVANFGDIITVSDRIIGVKEERNFHHPSLTKQTAQELMWYAPATTVRTSHFLIIQWDSWIIDPTMWKDDFLQYDYIGAPWWHSERNVGNGGFSLRSAKLARTLLEKQTFYPFCLPEDEVLCRIHRPILETEGFKWAPENIAFDFSFECVKPSRESRHFGFHCLRNWPLVMSKEQVEKRLEFATDYVRKSSDYSLVQNYLRQVA